MYNKQIPTINLITKHYGYYRQTFYDPGKINETIYVVFRGNLHSVLHPVALVKTESAAVSKCKLLEEELCK